MKELVRITAAEIDGEEVNAVNARDLLSGKHTARQFTKLLTGKQFI